MSVFVLGRSRSGKTPFAQAVCKKLAAQHIGASEWVRSSFKVDSTKSRAEQIDAMTKYSLGRLRENRRACVDFIQGKYDLNRLSVVEGIRSLHDFVVLFNPASDVVVFLDWENNDLVPTAFEEGIEQIRAHLKLQVKLGVIPKAAQVISYSFPDFWEAEGAVCRVLCVQDGVHKVSSLRAAMADFEDRACSELSLAAPPEQVVPATATRYRVHADVPPLAVQLRAQYLYDMDDAYKGKLLPATIFAVSSYPGEAPTFMAALADGSVFSYLPAQAFQLTTAAPEPELSMDELVYHNCKDGNICLCRFAQLADQKLSAFIRQRNLWIGGSYLFTIDWYEGNDLLHGLALDNGQLALLPNHKVKFSESSRAFPDFRKLHATWRVSEDALPSNT